MMFSHDHSRSRVVKLQRVRKQPQERVAGDSTTSALGSHAGCAFHKSERYEG